MKERKRKRERESLVLYCKCVTLIHCIALTCYRLPSCSEDRLSFCCEWGTTINMDTHSGLRFHIWMSRKQQSPAIAVNGLGEQREAATPPMFKRTHWWRALWCSVRIDGSEELILPRSFCWIWMSSSSAPSCSTRDFPSSSIAPKAYCVNHFECRRVAQCCKELDVPCRAQSRAHQKRTPKKYSGA